MHIDVNTVLSVIFGLGWLAGEILAHCKGIKANSPIQLVLQILVDLSAKIKESEDQKKG